MPDETQQGGGGTKLKQRAVAGSFIFKFPDDDVSRKPQVALFRRSGAVRTYQHKYAPISGSVESSDANPLATAWREIHEETSLTDSSLRLFRRGKPYSFADTDIGREWTINPFGFVLRPGAEAGIRLDWEHEGYEWFDPDCVGRDEAFGGVPRLRESLRRVWFEIDIGETAGRALADGLRVLQAGDGRDPATMASKTFDIFSDVLSKLDQTSSQEKWWSNARFVGWHLWINGHQHTNEPVLAAAVVSCLKAVETKLPDADSLPTDWAGVVAGAIEEQGKIDGGYTAVADDADGARRMADHYFSSL